MSKQTTENLAKFEAAFQKYLDAYMTRRDLASLKEMFAEDLCGFGTGFDEVAYSKNEGFEKFKKDIASAPNPLHYTFHHYEIKLLDQYNAIVVAQLDMKTKIMDQDVKMNNLRLTMMLHEEDSIIKIYSLHFSFPTEVHAEDESYPLKMLEERTKVLHRMVEEKTKNLQKTIAELKQSEEAVRKSEARFYDLVSHTSDYIYTLDEESRHTAVNRSICKDMGLEEHEVIGKNHMELGFPEEICNEWREMHQKVFSKKQVVTGETSTPMPDGIKHTYEVVLTPIFDENGNVKGINGISRNITDRKEKEDEIRKQKERLASILEGTNAGTWEWNVQTGETIFNERWAEIIGYTLEELLPVSIETWEKYTHPEDLNKSNNMLEKHFTGEIDYYDVECRMKHKEGHWVWVQVRGKVISWTDDGKPLWMFGTHQDVTERKQVEDALITSEKRLNTMLNNTPDTVVRFNKDLQHIYCNETVEREFGIPADFFIGKTFLDLDIPDQEAEKFKSMHQSLVKCLETGEKQYYDTELITPSGLKYYSTIIIPEKNNGSIESLLAVTRDITGAKQMENQLKKKAWELESIFNSAKTVSLIKTDLDGMIEIVSSGVKDIFGYDREEMIGRHVGMLHTREEAARLSEYVARLIQGKGFTMEARLIRKSREEFPALFSLQPVFNDQGQVISTLGISLDITEQKQAEKKREELSAEYETVFQSTQDAMFLVEVVDEDTFRFVRNNSKHEQATGLLAKEIRNKRPQEVVGEEMGAAIVENYKRCVQKKNPISYEETLDLPGGKRIWWTVLTPVIKSGVVSYIVGSGREITHRKQLEQNLIQRNQEVEHLNQHLNQEIEKAHQIHNNILPEKFPNIEGINFAAFYQPAETLGGDFYEVIQSNNKLVMYLSDISGHGLDGSMINFFVKEAIDSYITLKPEDLTPRSILLHLERQFRRESYPDELFIGMFLAVLDLETMKLTYSGAGFQDTPFVKQGNGERVKLTTKGLFINGTFPVDKENFQENTITLTPGSTIFFNTDGLTEQGEPGAFYGDRLPQVFYENSHLPPEEIAQAVVEDFKSFNKGSLQSNDDITFLILQVESEMIRHQLELTTDFLELEDLRNKSVRILPNTKKRDVLINCLYELTANAMEHGNQMDPTKKVMVDLVVSHDFIQVSVEDEGAGFNWREKIDNPFELEGLTERGRGIPLTRLLCNRLFYNDQGNKVTCVVHLGQGGGVCK